MHWEAQTYVNKVLPFGLRSVPKLYNAVADGLRWIMSMQDKVGRHSLLGWFGAPCSQQYANALHRAVDCCAYCCEYPLHQKRTKVSVPNWCFWE